ncbi:MAG: type II secretion system protein [Patescibacteria group bacterium]
MNYFSKNISKGLPREAKRSGGFTLTELIVVMAISSIILTSIVIQQNSWNSALAVKTQAYDLALMIRQAQIYSLGVREDIGGSGDKFSTGYGVYLDSLTTNSYIYFADRSNNKQYDTGEGTETKSLTRGVTIEKICGVRANNVPNTRCSDESGGNIPKTVDIVFLRPDPKANITFRDSDGSVLVGGNELISPLTIYLKSSDNKKVLITAESSGQISIQSI